MNFFEQSEYAMNPVEEFISGNNVLYFSEEERKMAWMRETRIRSFMQMEHEACLDDLNWLIRCHNCTAYNCPEEKYPPRPLPIPPDYIDNLQSKLVKANKGILPPSIKLILNTYNHLQHSKRPSIDSSSKFHDARKRSSRKLHSKCSPMI